MTEQIHALPWDLDAYLGMVMRQARTLVPFDSGGVLIYDQRADMLVPRVYEGAPLDNVRPIRRGEGITGRVAASRTALIVPDIRVDMRSIILDPDARAELAVPLVSGEVLYGVLNVESHKPGIYTAQHHAALLTLAEQVGLVLQMREGYRDVRHERDRLRHVLRVQQRENTTLYRLAALTSSSLHLEELLPAAVREIAELVECQGVQVWLPDLASYALAPHVPSRYGIVENWPTDPLPLDGSGEPLHVYHTGTQYLHQQPPPDKPGGTRELHNRLICPLNIGGRTLGVMELVNHRSGQFTDAHIEIAQTIANQIAVSISSVERLTTEQRRTALLGRINRISQELYATLDPQDLLRLMAQMIREVFDYDAVHVLLLAPDGRALQVQAVAHAEAITLDHEDMFSIDDQILRPVLRSGQSTIISDIRDVAFDCPLRANMPQIRSCLVIALRQADETIGLLVISSRRTHAFDEVDRDGLEMLGRQLSVALENAHLYHTAQRRLIEQGIVHQIGQDLSAILDFGQLAEAIVRHMTRALNSSACLLALYEPDSATVQIEADHRAARHRDSAGSHIIGEYLPLENHTAIREAIRTRRPVAVYRDDPDIGDDARALLDALGDHSQLVVPMVAGERVLGIVDWTDNQPGRRFTDDDRMLARTLVTQATIAVDNALLFRELEQRATELAEAYQLRSQFLATISHELRTPMNSIIGFTETLIDGIYGELNEEQAARLDRIRRNGYHLLTLIDDLLDLSKIEAGRMTMHPEIIGMGDATLTVLDGLRPRIREKDLLLDVEIPDSLPRVEADPQRLFQVLNNLISNAIKFTHAGTITIRCAAINRDGRPYIETRVSDTGIGISPENIETIFETFRQVDSSSTRAYEGTGMGLALTKKLVEMMGGVIAVESEVNVGSTFTVALPVATSERMGTVEGD